MTAGAAPGQWARFSAAVGSGEAALGAVVQGGGLSGEALCLRLAGSLQVLAVVPGECSGGPSLGSLTAVREEAGIPAAWCVGEGAVGPGGRGRVEKDGHATASPQASGGGRAFSSGNPSLGSPRAAPPLRGLGQGVGEVGVVPSAAVGTAPRAEPGSSREPPACGAGGGDEKGRCRAGLVRALGRGPGFESPLRPAVRRLAPEWDKWLSPARVPAWGRGSLGSA